MKKSFFLLLFTFLITFSNSYSQSDDDFTSVKNTIEINSRPLKVILKKGRSKSVKNTNDKLKEAFLSEWKINKNISFITYKEYKDNEVKGNSEFAYAFIKKETSISNGMASSSEAIIYFGSDFPNVASRTSFYLDQKDDKAEFFTIVQTLNNSVNYKVTIKKDQVYARNVYTTKNKKEKNKFLAEQVEKAKPALTSKTLLIDRKLIGKKTESKIKANYPFNYKIVSKEVINKAIVTNDNTKLILSKYDITDADTGIRVMTFYTAKDQKQKLKISPFGFGLGNKIKTQHLNNLGSYFN